MPVPDTHPRRADEDIVSASVSGGAKFVERRQIWMCSLLLIAAGMLAYENSFAGVFVYDDFPAIVKNQKLRSLSDTWRAGMRSRPVGELSFALNRSLHDLDVWGYHAVNLAIHLTSGLLLMGFVRRTLLLLTSRPAFQTHSTGIAFCVAFLWVVHPLQTESVTYIVQRFESLMGMFFLACLYAIVRSESPSGGLWHTVAVLAASFSMGTKEVGIMIPVVAILYDWAFLARSWKQILQRRGWMYCAIITAAVWYFAPAARNWEDIYRHTSESSQNVIYSETNMRWPTSWEYLRSQPGVLCHYVKLAFWPRDLCLDYAWPIATKATEIYGKGALVLVFVLSGLCLLAIRPKIAFVILCFFLILAPSSTIVPLHLAFEHRMYLPLACLITGTVLAVFQALCHLGRYLGEAGRVAMIGTGAVTVVMGLLLIIFTRQRNEDYHSCVAMWKDVVRVRPANFRAHSDLAIFASNDGDMATAERHYLISMQLEPRFAPTYYNYGIFLSQRQKRHEQSIPYFKRAIELSPRSALFRFGLGNAMDMLGRSEEAEAAFRTGLELSPRDAIGRLRMGQVLRGQNRDVEAEHHLKLSVELGPYLWQTYRELGQIDVSKGDIVAAIAHYQTAIDDPRVRVPPIFLQELSQLRQDAARGDELE